MIALMVVGGGAAFALAYAFYGRHLITLFGLRSGTDTPAHALRDDRDYCPARAPVLFGHHFSSIAGAGPIVGPIFATLVFGWLPAVLWIVLGAIFIGGVHDLGALALSIKHRAMTIAEIARVQLSPRASKLFLAFIWLTMVYVLVVFLDLTVATFAPDVPAGMPELQAKRLIHRGGGVASASVLFVVLAMALGLVQRRHRSALGAISLIFVPLTFAAVFVGQLLPLSAENMPIVAGTPATTWRLILVVYCFVASVAPVWLLLQPRDYLSSFLLYACLIGGVAGILLSAVSATADVALVYPAFLGFHSDKLGFLFPALFITIACGACSGFHSIVASGTTAKQLDREADARAVGYGSMLVEGLLALVSVATVAVLAQGSPQTHMAPPALFASGLSRFLALLGIPAELGQSFGMLALSTFLLTTLDTCTRLGRYVLTELLSLTGRRAAYVTTLATLALPLILGLMTFHDPQGLPVPAWKIIWPVFGATNQLLGGLALMVLTVWLRRSGRRIWTTALPMVFMLAATLVALAQLVFRHGFTLVGIIAALLLALALVLLLEAARTLRKAPADALNA